MAGGKKHVRTSLTCQRCGQAGWPSYEDVSLSNGPLIFPGYMNFCSCASRPCEVGSQHDRQIWREVDDWQDGPDGNTCRHGSPRRSSSGAGRRCYGVDGGYMKGRISDVSSDKGCLAGGSFTDGDVFCEVGSQHDCHIGRKVDDWQDGPKGNTCWHGSPRRSSPGAGWGCYDEDGGYIKGCSSGVSGSRSSGCDSDQGCLTGGLFTDDDGNTCENYGPSASKVLEAYCVDGSRKANGARGCAVDVDCCAVGSYSTGYSEEMRNGTGEPLPPNLDVFSRGQELLGWHVMSDCTSKGLLPGLQWLCFVKLQNAGRQVLSNCMLYSRSLQLLQRYRGDLRLFVRTLTDKLDGRTKTSPHLTMKYVEDDNELQWPRGKVKLGKGRGNYAALYQNQQTRHNSKDEKASIKNTTRPSGPLPALKELQFPNYQDEDIKLQEMARAGSSTSLQSNGPSARSSGADAVLVATTNAEGIKVDQLEPGRADALQFAKAAAQAL
ncbi:hypothetical protein AK812_SmicGene2765 [Symbiodinium microadriaticum]|uniref:Uncharacterized protein n=1 Tax=Symbiodinium microadriaticum TaxID=2951 RepID=A0A1Q9F0I0_SYMMI|nr:hypothetical protein AK812_SmicGene2765 [Symbiodinium microadriaticum]